jgi:hypothetical protein
MPVLQAASLLKSEAAFYFWDSKRASMTPAMFVP